MYGQDIGGSGQQPGAGYGGNGSYSTGGGYGSSGGSGGGGVAYGSGDSYGGRGGSDGRYSSAGGRGGGNGGGRGYGGNSQSRGYSSSGGYQGGDRAGRGSSGGRGAGHDGSDREGDWRCPNPDCGNLNFARRDKCNKCGALPSAGTGDRSDRGGGSYNRATNGGGYGNNRGAQRDNYSGGRGRGGYGDNRGGRGDSYDGEGGGGSGSYGQGRDDGGYNQRPPVASSYGGRDNDSTPRPNVYNGAPDYATDAVPPPSSYTGGPSYGSSGGYGGSSPSVTGNYGSGIQADAFANVKQCDENCGETCDNSRIYISNLPPNVTIDELQQLFGSIGLVAKVKQKRGYKDQWPWSIKLYTDERGNNKGDAVLSFEDPSAAHSAGGFFNNHDLRGHKIAVAMAEKSAPKATQQYGSSQGSRGGYGGDRRRDNNREGGSGPDRSYHGGNRSRPY